MMKRHPVLGCAFALLLVSMAGLSGARADTPLTCRAAAEAAEQAEGLPAGLLLAIGRIESGRYDPATGQVDPWPWTANLAGIDHVFASSGDATDWTRAQRAAGHASIDVGCFQINLFYHPDAFESLDEAYEPAANGRYAARFLATLYRRVGNWQLAVAQYHSADPALGGPYGSRVFSAWASPGQTFAALPGLSVRAMPIMVWSPTAFPPAPNLLSSAIAHDWHDPVVVRLSLRARAVRLVVPDAASIDRLPSPLPQGAKAFTHLQNGLCFPPPLEGGARGGVGNRTVLAPSDLASRQISERSHPSPSPSLKGRGEETAPGTMCDTHSPLRGGSGEGCSHTERVENRNSVSEACGYSRPASGTMSRRGLPRIITPG